ncbi:MAG: hypothetical protein WCN92_12660, partial [Eubacteriales bacterium]
KVGKPNCRKDGDLDSTAPLRISLDYNAAINNIVTGIVKNRVLKSLSWMYVKTPRKIKEVCNDWCDYYQPHQSRNNTVVYYYDSTAIADSADGDATPFYEIVTGILISRGWRVIQVYIGQQMRHHKKHTYIDLALKGESAYLFPMFNKHGCEFLIQAMEQTGVKVGRNGFEKDKDIEKTPDSPENPDELKTHGTDAWDTLFIGCNFHNAPIDSSISSATSFGG